MHPITAFFKLIRLGIGVPCDNHLKLDAPAWDAVAEMAHKQTLSAVTLDGISCLLKEDRPPHSIVLRLISFTQRIEADNRRLNASLVKVSRRFEKEGMPGVVLKGQGVAALYPNPLHRTSGDIDFWVKGSRAQIINYATRFYPNAEVFYHHVDFNVLKDVEIELHFTPSWMNQWLINCRAQRFFAACLEPSLQNRISLPEQGETVSVPTVLMNRVYMLIHICRHIFSDGVGLRQLLDYYFVLRQPCSEIDRVQTLRTVRVLHLTRLAEAVMYVLQTVFALPDEFLLLPPNKARGKRLLREVLLAGNFGKYDERISIPEKETNLQRFCRRVERNLSFTTDYPGEALWSPVFKLCHYAWRKKHGYLKN